MSAEGTDDTNGTAGTARVYVKTTQDGRTVEVIAGVVCLGGAEEAWELIPIIEHPNRQAILRAVPNASHMAGRLPLTLTEAGIAQGAIMRARQEIDPDPKAVMERMRRVTYEKAWKEGIE